MIQIHLAALLAGFTGLFGKFLSVSPFVITAGRTFFGGAALYLACRVLRISLALRTRHDLYSLGISGALLAAHWFTFFQAVQVSTVAVGLLAFSSFPLFVTLLEPVFFGERLHVRDVVVTAIVVLGLILVVPRFSLANQITQGVLWGVASGLCYALLSLLSRRHVASYPSMAITFYQQCFACAFSLPCAIAGGAEALDTRAILLLVTLGLVFTALAQSLFVASLRHIRAHTASVVIGLEPVYGIVFAAVLLGEIPQLRTLFGGTLICGAVLGASVYHARSRAVQPLVEQ